MTASLADLSPTEWTGGTLATVVPAVAEALDVPFEITDSPTLTPGFSVPTARDVVILLVDGLGATLLADHADAAPTLAALQTSTLRAGFPATTATSLTSLSVGADCGVHGIVGYSFRPDDDVRARGNRRTLNALRWTLDDANGPSAVQTYPPALVQNQPTALEALAGAGVKITYVMPGEFKGTGLTLATFRAPGRHIPAVTREGVRTGISLALTRMTPVGRSTHRLVYAYYGALDMTGHLHGPGSAPWVEELRRVDTMVADIASDLGPDTTLLVTGDHGMIAAGEAVDIDTTPELTAGTVAVAGEARVRHVYTDSDDAARDVAAAWSSILGDAALVARRDEAIALGWFGHRVDDAIARRVGDVVAVARGTTVLVRSEREPMEAGLAGQHGAWTHAEQLVPLLTATG